MEEVLFRIDGQVGRVHLNQPKSFNALTKEMCIALRDRLVAWADDPAVAAVVVTAEGDRAFCAGGDIRKLYDSGRAKDPDTHLFFWHEYRLDVAVHDFPKPYVSLIDGIVMGGGVGISVHGSHRVLTERALFAMPETEIGLFPDVGATTFLRACPPGVGMYLALTGARLKAADALYAGIGTHFVPSARLRDLSTALAAADLAGDARAGVNAVIARFAADPGPPDLRDHANVIARAFVAPLVEAVLQSLRAEDGYFAIDTADVVESKSPTSLKVTHRQLTRPLPGDFRKVMQLEYRMACHFLENHDFFEGIRAAVIDKDRSPKWRPARLADVGAADVEAYFAPLAGGELSYN
jgi:enoyl-CoA hydratase